MGRSPGDIPAQPADRRHRLAEIILDESRRAGLRQGSRLPTERQLAASLGATRTSVRRALTVLEAEGRISREVGRGTFLREEPDTGNGAAAESARSADDVAERLLGPGGLRPGDQGGFAPADVMTVRRLLEPPAMRLVVAWATAADFEEIGRCLAGGEHQNEQRSNASHRLARRMRISSTFVPARSVTVVSTPANPGRSNRSVCVPGGSSSRCTGRSPRNSPST